MHAAVRYLAKPLIIVLMLMVWNENALHPWTDDKKEGILHASSDLLNAAVAQWIEYWPPKPRVAGSIPASRAINRLRTSLVCLS